MLVSTPTKPYAHGNGSMPVSPSFNIRQRRCTPPQFEFDSPMLSPSPLRHRPLFSAAQSSASAHDSDDMRPHSPLRSQSYLNSNTQSPALAQFSNPFYTTKPQPIPADDEEGSIFLSSSTPCCPSASASTHTIISPLFASTSKSLLTPVKQSHRTSGRHALAPMSLNNNSHPHTVPQPSIDNMAGTRVGVGTKRKSTSNVTPHRPVNLTPLKISTSKDLDSDSLVAFDRLAPLPAPKFSVRTPQTKAETEAYLKRQTATLTRLRLSDHHIVGNGNGKEDELDDEVNDSGCGMDEDEDESENELFLSKPRLGAKAKGGCGASQFTKPLVFTPLNLNVNMNMSINKENDEVVEAVSPGGHVTKRRARSRPLSAELLETYNKSPIKSGIPCRVGTRPRYSGNIIFPPSTTAHRACASPSSTSSSSSDAGSPRPRRRAGPGAANAPRNNHHAMLPSRPPLSRIDSVSAATLFFGPAILPKPPTNTNHNNITSTPAPTPLGPMTRSRTSSSGVSAPKPASGSGTGASSLRPPNNRNRNLANRHSYAGVGSNGSVDLRAWNTVQTRGSNDVLSPGSSPFHVSVDPGNSSFGQHSMNAEDEDMDMFFAGDDSFKLNTSAGNSTLSPGANLSAILGYSPTGTRRSTLPRKYRAPPRDGSDEDEEVPSTGSSSTGNVSARRNGGGSVSSVCSDEGLVTPGVAPESFSGWPMEAAGVFVDDAEDEQGSSPRRRRRHHPYMYPGDGQETSVDAFIVKTLAAASKAPAAGVEGLRKKAPGTPVKKTRMSYFGGERPWQSAVAMKVGLRDDCEFVKEGGFGREGGLNWGVGGGDEGKRGGSRKSMPAAFSQVGVRAAQLFERDGVGSGYGQGTDTEEEEGAGGEESPSTRREGGRYLGLGLGQPRSVARNEAASANGSATVGKAPLQRNRWLMRRSSSGAFSSGSEQTSAGNTPTRGIGDWNLPKPRLPLRLSPSRDGVSKTTSRSTSGSSNSSMATLNSPTDYRRRSLGTTTTTTATGASAQRHSTAHTHTHHTHTHNHHLAPRQSNGGGGGVGMSESIFTEDGQAGRFERDFEEIEEIGSGEFGKVIKVQSKTGRDGVGAGGKGEVYAIKKSKQFEGVKHRLRLREEVNILKHLSQAALTQYTDGRHPNVLSYIDSWEENEALYICTELCESGNLARFLWEYGRAYPRLDEARVWKIVVDLSNGLRFIHDSGVIHLDLKPSNVFLTKGGRFKIGDFGMASLWPRPVVLPNNSNASASHSNSNGGATSGASDSEMLGGGGSIGSSGFEREGDKVYLAPEVLQGRYGKAADVFSLGMTILETATNIVVPDQGEGWQRLRREDFSQVDLEEESPELAELILDMMRTDPERRVTVKEICAHGVVRRAREAMEEMEAVLRREGKSVWGASPLASVPAGFLDDILDRGEVLGAMDTSV